MANEAPVEKQAVVGERWRLLRQIDATLDKPMTVLSFVWLGLMILDLTESLPPTLALVSDGIWALFILNFAIEFAIAPSKWAYLRSHWLTALALFLPAFRALRVLRAFRFLRYARATRSLNLVRVLTSLNRGVGATRRTLRRRGFGYVVALSAVVTFGGAAGMYFFERPEALREDGLARVADEGGGLPTYGDALWWTAMIMTTMGSEYWPRTAEGRVLGFLLAVYAFAVFGYITAVLASYFIGKDQQQAAPAGEAASLRGEVAALRVQIAALLDELAERRGANGAARTARRRET